MALMLKRELEEYQDAVDKYMRKYKSYNASVSQYNESVLMDSKGRPFVSNSFKSDGKPNSYWVVQPNGEVVESKERPSVPVQGASAIKGGQGFYLLRGNLPMEEKTFKNYVLEDGVYKPYGDPSTTKQDPTLKAFGISSGSQNVDPTKVAPTFKQNQVVSATPAPFKTQVIDQTSTASLITGGQPRTVEKTIEGFNVVAKVPKVVAMPGKYNAGPAPEAPDPTISQQKRLKGPTMAQAEAGLINEVIR